MDPLLDALDEHLDEQVFRGVCSCCNKQNAVVVDVDGVNVCADDSTCLPIGFEEDFDLLQRLIRTKGDYDLSWHTRKRKSGGFSLMIQIWENFADGSLFCYPTASLEDPAELVGNTKQLIEFFGDDLDAKVSQMVFEKPDLLQLDLEMEI